MASQQLIFRGEADLGEGPIAVEIWASAVAAVAFEGGQQRGVLTQLQLSLDEERRLRLSGLDAEGEPAVWQAQPAERVVGRWITATVAWPSGTSWTQAEVAWSQYGVRVTAPGQTPRDLLAARTEAIGAQRWIVLPDGSRISASAGRAGCGCGGGR